MEIWRGFESAFHLLTVGLSLAFITAIVMGFLH